MGVLIRSYGELWSPDLVHWGSVSPTRRGELLGEFGSKRWPTVVDVWEQRGIYVLWHEWRAVYVGKADKVALGARLRGHLTGGLAGRWDRFSWYGVRGVNANGELGVNMLGKQAPVKDLISTLESLLIVIAEPPKNRRQETVPGARLVRQLDAAAPRPMASYIDELRAEVFEIHQRLDDL